MSYKLREIEKEQSSSFLKFNEKTCPFHVIGDLLGFPFSSCVASVF